MLELFQRLLLTCWLNWRCPLGNATVLDDEPLTHFLFSRGTEFSVTDGVPRLKAAGLIPFKYMELSVYRVRNLGDWLIWKIGDVFVAAGRRRPILARASFKAAAIVAVELQVVSKEPPPRHADLQTWPAEKHLQMSIAQQIIREGQPTVELRNQA